jgi:hypothetical protein
LIRKKSKKSISPDDPTSIHITEVEFIPVTNKREIKETPNNNSLQKVEFEVTMNSKISTEPQNFVSPTSQLENIGNKPVLLDNSLSFGNNDEN